ncbi:MAG: hypothetical protein KTR31_35515 [Myxococcales bacterium]|nr:hypothetical protein [Myxococcales bacterium]
MTFLAMTLAASHASVPSSVQLLDPQSTPVLTARDHTSDHEPLPFAVRAIGPVDVGVEVPHGTTILGWECAADLCETALDVEESCETSFDVDDPDGNPLGTVAVSIHLVGPTDGSCANCTVDDLWAEREESEPAADANELIAACRLLVQPQGR